MSAPQIPIQYDVSLSEGLPAVLAQLREIRKVELVHSTDVSAPRVQSENLLKQLQAISTILSVAGHSREAETLQDVYALSILDTDFGGLGLVTDLHLSKDQETSVLFLVSAWLESLNSADRSKIPPSPLTTRPPGRRGMTLSEKIFAAHDIERRGSLKPGDMVRVDVDWIMASELSWGAMANEYDALGKPGIFRNDRFWLAGDHVVDPRIMENPKVKSMVSVSERAKKEFSMTEYQGMNYTIMHTEFFRERAQPGLMVIGSDSHTCSAGSVGCLAIGLGVSDVTMPLITGETWFKVPESVNIHLINAPGPGIGGKDTILYIMKELKRNTVAADRVVEFTGPGLKHLSCDARFAIANMTTEFGGITGIFVPDEITYDFINRRKSPRHKKNATYFRPDDDAQYASSHIIDLAQVESFVALYPKPDDVVSVRKVEGTHLDGCFIGACTTAEEDLVIGAMVLEIGFEKGLVPIKEGKRRVVPGSLPILNRLKSTGLADVYENAGFTIGVPGCSYCVGMGADKAGAGEVWLSSQNRNFENRMGTGSIGNLSSAATVAASSFEMKITDPRPFLDEIDLLRLEEILAHGAQKRAKQTGTLSSPIYVEPYGTGSTTSNSPANVPESTLSSNEASSEQAPVPNGTPKLSSLQDVRKGKIQSLGDFIDTDALAPAEILTTCKTNEEFGQHCLKYTHPSFRQRAKDGYTVVVAGSAFGCGSSRENAVSALLGNGIICVIAKSFAFIYGRNQPNLGMLGITITEESFYEAASDGKECVIDLTGLTVSIEGSEKKWGFELSPMEKKLAEVGGITSAFQKFGKDLFSILCAPKATRIATKGLVEAVPICGNGNDLQW